VADAARLACYDAAFGRASSGMSTSGGPAQPAGKVSAPSAKLAAPAAGGTTANAVDKFGDYGQLERDRHANSDLPKRESAQIIRLASLPNGRVRLTLDNQQSWDTTEADWAIVFKVGERVQIDRLPLGGYQVSLVGNNHSVGAKRTR
jgi:hypothetical protein